MIDLIIIVVLLGGFFIGLKRGLILQIVRIISYFAAFFVAYTYSASFAPSLKSLIPYPAGATQSLSVWLSSGNVEEGFYKAIAFIILFFLTILALSLVGHVLNILAQIPVIKQANALGGGILGFVEVYMLVFVIIIVGTILPIQQVQSTIHQSALCKVIADDTPVLSDKVKEVWSTKA
ncbi:CvpA family protein [Ectobacillus polymachus]|uniref:CvpA family protein n=1 Tax=Ectobacillus polymachus TaxID=1508806 RepID=UPI003A868284